MNSPQTSRPKRLLSRSNRNLARDGIFSWTIPALSVRLPDGSTFRTCPAADACASLCYALTGTYRFTAVKAAHMRNLLFVLEDPDGWEAAMMAELARPVMKEKKVRIHDAGDFFSDAYLAAWIRIIQANPHVYFYAYTKEVSRYRRLVEPSTPANSGWVLSLGGREDEFIDPSRDRIADVFPTEADILSLLNVRVDARREGSQSDGLAGVLGTAGCGAGWRTAAVAGGVGRSAVPRGRSRGAGR